MFRNMETGQAISVVGLTHDELLDMMTGPGMASFTTPEGDFRTIVVTSETEDGLDDDFLKLFRQEGVGGE